MSARSSGLRKRSGETFLPVHGPVPLATAAPDKAAGENDPNWGVGNADLVGLGADDRLVVAMIKYVAPTATRPGVGDTPRV